MPQGQGGHYWPGEDIKHFSDILGTFALQIAYVVAEIITLCVPISYS